MSKPIRLDQVKINWQEELEGLECEAKACVSYVCSNDGTRRLEWLHSGGLSGIDFDASNISRHVIEKDELENLKNHLEAFGIDLSNWDELIKDLLPQGETS